jgi:hypothetical protein
MPRDGGKLHQGCLANEAMAFLNVALGFDLGQLTLQASHFRVIRLHDTATGESLLLVRLRLTYSATDDIGTDTQILGSLGR